ncbi:hypothetical protein BKA61DRAFT_720593 [Leptodontidium sp. MPI-SDFR-AT-0119]|nr:hypothetical protein BKA61DRAFT_720593 [Leptodontidium sp. MPI-SDFR-AT-0119]
MLETRGGGGTIASGSIMDDSGEPLETLSGLKIGTSNSTTFELEEDDGPVYSLGWTKSADVQMDYHIEAPPPNVTSTSTSSSSSTGSSTGTGASVSATSAKSGSGRVGDFVMPKAWALVLVGILVAV